MLFKGIHIFLSFRTERPRVKMKYTVQMTARGTQAEGLGVCLSPERIQMLRAKIDSRGFWVLGPRTTQKLKLIRSLVDTQRTQCLVCKRSELPRTILFSKTPSLYLVNFTESHFDLNKLLTSDMSMGILVQCSSLCWEFDHEILFKAKHFDSKHSCRLQKGFVFLSPSAPQ